MWRSGSHCAHAKFSCASSCSSTGSESNWIIPPCALIEKHPLATLPNRVHFLNVDPFVYSMSIDLDPRVRLERSFVRSDHHVGGHTKCPQHARCDCRALHTQAPFRIPTTRVVHRVPHSID